MYLMNSEFDDTLVESSTEMMHWRVLGAGDF